MSKSIEELKLDLEIAKLNQAIAELTIQVKKRELFWFYPRLVFQALNVVFWFVVAYYFFSQIGVR